MLPATNDSHYKVNSFLDRTNLALCSVRNWDVSLFLYKTWQLNPYVPIINGTIITLIQFPCRQEKLTDIEREYSSRVSCAVVVTLGKLKINWIKLHFGKNTASCRSKSTATLNCAVWQFRLKRSPGTAKNALLICSCFGNNDTSPGHASDTIPT